MRPGRVAFLFGVVVVSGIYLTRVGWIPDATAMIILYSWQELLGENSIQFGWRAGAVTLNVHKELFNCKYISIEQVHYVLFVLTQKEPKKSRLFKNWLKLFSLRCKKITRHAFSVTQTDFLATLVRIIS